jgi:leucyl-tRNA synthetase
MLYERGLAYQAESLVNYDPVDKTVLANEQVDANGCSWRSGAKVEKLMLKQWFLKIKEFQEPLLKDLDILAENGNWPERVLAMQKNWIGRSVGTTLSFELFAGNKHGEKLPEVKVFTTRADTLFGVQYLALSLNHPIVETAAKEDGSLCEWLEQAQNLPPDSKAGYLLNNVVAANPLSIIAEGYDNSIPVYAAPYVLADYGSGAVMGVPGHDARDHAFWRTNTSDSPIRKVIVTKPGEDIKLLMPGAEEDRPSLEKGYIAANIQDYSNLASDVAVKQLFEDLEDAGAAIEHTDNWRLRDWLISRQRYWGTPIPIVHCDSCGPVPVPNSDLPIELPQLSNEYFKGKTGNPLEEHPTWKKTECPKCGSAAERETDTMDTFMDSSWYFFRFLDPRNKDLPVAHRKAANGMPVDVYVGGVEHAILHLLYARFLSKFLATTDIWPEGKSCNGEPFKKLITQGMVHGKTYTDPSTGRFLRPEEVDRTKADAPIIIATGETPKVSYEKMSKSKYNGVDPGATIAEYGADVTRAHMLFQAPVSDVLEWDTASITGIQRWLSRVVKLSQAQFIPPQLLSNFSPSENMDQSTIEILRELRRDGILKEVRSDQEQTSFLTEAEELINLLSSDEQVMWSRVQEIIASVTKSYTETYSLNTIISDLMTLTNVIWDAPHTSDASLYLKYYALNHLLRMLAPIAPATAEECWETLHTRTANNIRTQQSHPLRLNGRPGVFAFGFPVADLGIIPALNMTTTCVFQLDGKKKFEVDIGKVPASIKTEETIKINNYVLNMLAETDQGKEWIEPGEGKLWKAAGTNETHSDYPLLPKDCKVIVPGRGKLVNVVTPKRKKGAKKGGVR